MASPTSAAMDSGVEELLERLEARRASDECPFGKHCYCDIEPPHGELYNPDGPAAAALIRQYQAALRVTPDKITEADIEWAGQQRIKELEDGLSASVGYLLNAKIDLETGATKATAIRTIEGGIARARALLGERGE